jgi:hypothetical protein
VEALIVADQCGGERGRGVPGGTQKRRAVGLPFVGRRILDGYYEAGVSLSCFLKFESFAAVKELGDR